MILYLHSIVFYLLNGTNVGQKIIDYRWYI